MNKKSVILIDDEPLALDVLNHYFDFLENYEVKKSFIDPVEALKYLKKNKIDLVVTDIAMPNISGLDLVKIENSGTRFIMVTSFSEYAIESFELNVVDYLLKPVSKDRFQKAISHYEETIKSLKSEVKASFYVKNGDAFVKVVIEEIDYIEGMKDYAKIVCGENYYMVLKTLKSFESFLSKHSFSRVHKSFIAPLSKIEQYNGRYIIIESHSIPVGGSYRENVKNHLKRNSI